MIAAGLKVSLCVVAAENHVLYVQANTSLTCLNISGNNISADGCRAIAELLQVNDAHLATPSHCRQTNWTLTTLLLAENDLRDGGASAIAEGLKVRSCSSLAAERELAVAVE